MITTPAEKAETDFFAQSPQARRRIPLGELASRGSAAAIPALARIMPDAASMRPGGPGGLPILQPLSLY